MIPDPVNKDFSLSIREQDSDVQLGINEIKDDSELEVSVKLAPTELPDTHKSDGNTMKCLENALLQRFGYEPESLNKNQRNDLLKELLPKVTNFHGKLPKTDQAKAESPVELETYEEQIPARDRNGDVIMENGEPKIFMTYKGIKVKMLWQMEVDVGNGKKEILEFSQYVKTACALPTDLSDKDGINHTKQTALLYVKIHKNLHKKALLGGRYELQHEKAINVQHLVNNLRSSNRLKITHYPNPAIFEGKSSTSRLIGNKMTLRPGDREAQFSEVELSGGIKVFVPYSGDFDIKGRRLKAFKKGDELPNGAGKAQHAMTKYVKVNAPNEAYDYFDSEYDPSKHKVDPDEWDPLKHQHDPSKLAISYSRYLYKQADDSILKDPQIEKYNELAKTESNDIKQEIDQKDVDVKDFGNYQKKMFQNEAKNFDLQENQLRLHVLGKWASVRSFSLGVGEFFSSLPVLNLAAKPLHWINKNLLTRKGAIKKLVGAQETILEDLIKKGSSLDPNEKQMACMNMQMVCKELGEIRTEVKKLEEYKDSLKIRFKHMKQLQPDMAKYQKKVMKNLIKDVDKRCDLYKGLLEKMDQAELFF